MDKHPLHINIAVNTLPPEIVLYYMFSCTFNVVFCMIKDPPHSSLLSEMNIEPHPIKIYCIFSFTFLNPLQQLGIKYLFINICYLGIFLLSANT